MAATPLHVTDDNRERPHLRNRRHGRPPRDGAVLSERRRPDRHRQRAREERGRLRRRRSAPAATLLDGEQHARFDVGERGVLLAVSDGMGGAQAGEVASALVVETLTRAMAERRRRDTRATRS